MLGAADAVEAVAAADEVAVISWFATTMTETDLRLCARDVRWQADIVNLEQNLSAIGKSLAPDLDDLLLAIDGDGPCLPAREN